MNDSEHWLTCPNGKSIRVFRWGYGKRWYWAAQGPWSYTVGSVKEVMRFVRSIMARECAK